MNLLLNFVSHDNHRERLLCKRALLLAILHGKFHFFEKTGKCIYALIMRSIQVLVCICVDNLVIVHYFVCLTTQVDLLEKQKKEAEEQEALEKVDDESKLNDTDPIAELVSRSDSAEEKPDINDIPMEENEVNWLMNFNSYLPSI